jgi:putative peptidoglycan lipid II flippase
VSLPEPGGARYSTSRLLQSSAIVSIGSALSRLTGFARVAAIAYAFGTTTIAGVYSYANETPNIVYELLLGGVLTATLVPQFVRHLQDDDEDATSAVFTVSMLALLAITVIGIVAAPLIVQIYTVGVSGHGRAAQQELATALLRMFMVQMVFYGLTALATAMLQARRRFAAAALAPVLNNIVVVAIFVALPQIASRPFTVNGVLHDDGILLLLGLGTTAGIAAMGLSLLPALRAARVRLRFLPDWRNDAVRRLVRLSGWTVGYVGANQIALGLVLVLANEKAGGAFVYTSAYLFFIVPHGLLAFPIMTAVAPELAEAGRRGDPPALRHRFARALRLSLTVLIPAAAVTIALADPVVSALLQHGGLTAAGASRIADTLVGFAVGLPFFSTYLFALRAFYSLDDTRTPFVLGCFENGVNIVLALALFGSLGIPGLAFAYSGAYAAAAVVTLVVLSRRIGSLRGRGIGLLVVRVVAVSAVAGAVAWYLGDAIGHESTASAVAASAVGLVAAVAVTIGGLTLLRVREFTDVVGLVAGRFRRHG